MNEADDTSNKGRNRRQTVAVAVAADDDDSMDSSVSFHRPERPRGERHRSRNTCDISIR